MLGSPILYLKGMRILMFQLSGFYCKGLWSRRIGGGWKMVRDEGPAERHLH